ncbi:class I SAM-dependent methyltransferase [Planctomycetota bacterium]
MVYIKTSNLTHGFQGDRKASVRFYKLWAPLYDLTVRLDPAYKRNLVQMIKQVVQATDCVLEIGCGTGLGTVAAAEIAKEIVALDPSPAMLDKLARKLRRGNIRNVEVRKAYFPDGLEVGETYECIITSFMLAHLSPEARPIAIKSMFEHLTSGGRIGLFEAQGEIAPTFQTKKEIETNLLGAGFDSISIEDVSDIYRIATAVKR